MTILERLAATKTGIIADLLERHKTTSQTPQAAPWDNRPGWDNWKQKTPAWKKKKVYFRNK